MYIRKLHPPTQPKEKLGNRSKLCVCPESDFLVSLFLAEVLKSRLSYHSKLNRYITLSM